MTGWNYVLPWKERLSSFCQHLRAFIPGFVNDQVAAQDAMRIGE